MLAFPPADQPLLQVPKPGPFLAFLFSQLYVVSNCPGPGMFLGAWERDGLKLEPILVEGTLSPPIVIYLIEYMFGAGTEARNFSELSGWLGLPPMENPRS